MFMSGHSTEYLDDMNHWTFIDITSRLSKQRSERNQQATGKTVFKNLKPSQKKMIEDRKKLEAAGKI